MFGGGWCVRRGLGRVKAEAALSVLAANIVHAANAFGQARIALVLAETTVFSVISASGSLILVKRVMDLSNGMVVFL